MTLGGPLQQDKLFYFLAADYQRGRSTKQTDPTRIEPRVVTALAGFGIADDNGPIERTDDALVILAKADWHVSQAHLATLRYTYTWSEQKNGTFDVDSWGRSANADREGLLQGRDRDADLDALEQPRQRVPRTVGPGGPAASLQRPEHHRPDPAAARHGLRLREALPVRRALLHPGRLPRHAHPVQRQRLLPDRRTHDQGRRRVQPGQLHADLPRLRQRTLDLQLDGRLPELREEPQLRGVLQRHHLADRRVPGRQLDHRPRSLLPPAGGRGRPQRRAGGHAVHHPEGARGLPPGHLAADLEPDDQRGPALGGADRAGSDHAARTRSSTPVSSERRPRARRSLPTARSRRTRRCGSRASGSPGTRSDGKTVVRGTCGHLLRPVPGLVLASSRSTNGSIGQTIYRDSTFRNFGGPCRRPIRT